MCDTDGQHKPITVTIILQKVCIKKNVFVTTFAGVAAGALPSPLAKHWLIS